jgi:hypothetical protein
MAKAPSKQKKKINALKVALRQLVEADEESVDAVRELGTALQIQAPKIRLKSCKFKVDGVDYSVKVTAYQREQILDAVNQQKDVFVAVITLLGELNVAVVSAYNGLLAQLEEKSGPESGHQVVLGCCSCANGKLPNLTQAQCAQYANDTWGPPPDCSDATR